MSNLISLKDSLRSVVEVGSRAVQDGISKNLNVHLAPETLIDLLSIVFQYRHAKESLESEKEEKLKHLYQKHVEVMKVITQQCGERNSMLEKANSLITEGIKTSNTEYISQGILILRELLDKPIERG